MGQLYIVQKKLTEAIALFDEAIELNPDLPKHTTNAAAPNC